MDLRTGMLSSSYRLQSNTGGQSCDGHFASPSVSALGRPQVVEQSILKLQQATTRVTVSGGPVHSQSRAKGRVRVARSCKKRSSSDSQVAGVPPRIMGIGPSAAIPKLLSKFALTKDDIDIIEINEAFASMAVYCIDVLGLDHAKVNPRGGAIVLGHPLGATGARQICTILSEARRTKKKVLLTSMCIGTGQGMAGLFINEQL